MESPRKRRIEEPEDNFMKQASGEDNWWDEEVINHSGNSGNSGNIRGNNSNSNENNRENNESNTNRGTEAESIRENVENGAARNREDTTDSKNIQVGQRIERDRKGEFRIGKEKRRTEAGHPQRLDRILTYSAQGYWLQTPQGPGFVGKWPKISVPLRVEPYRENEEEGDKSARYACAYGKNARELLCWYSFDEWKEHFHSYEIPTPTECTFMNGELFTTKIIEGRWGDEREEIDEDNRQDDYQRSGYRGRGGWSGYGRGQARNYDEGDYNQRGRGGFRPRGRGGYRGGRGQ